MTTVREALRRLEDDSASEPSRHAPPPRARRRAPWIAAAAAVALIVVALSWLPRPRPAPPVVSATDPAAPSARREESAPPPQAAAAPMEEAPRGRVEQWRPVGHPGAPRAADPGSSGWTDEAADGADAAVQDGSGKRSAPVVLGDGRRIELRAIAFSNVQETRTATLAIDGGADRIVHEGQMLGDVEVQLILRRSVYVRQGGTVVALTR